jgi:hypothetical protein
MKQLITNYTFNKTAKTIKFDDFNIIELESLLMITNISNVNKPVLYQFNNPELTATVTGNTLTLSYDTSSMNNSDVLQIFYDEIIDNKILLTSTITGISQSTNINTTHYGSLVAQFSGVWVGKIYFETSNDGVFWDTCFILSRDEISLQDVIDQNGTYSIKRSGKYIRWNCQKISGTANVIIVGREGEGLSGADLLSFAMATEAMGESLSKSPIMIATTGS